MITNEEVTYTVTRTAVELWANRTFTDEQWDRLAYSIRETMNYFVWEDMTQNLELLDNPE
jgi:leucyl aminopeptidase (aminopeptidase T)